MINFSIGTQIENEIRDFLNKKVRLASTQDLQNDAVRYGKTEPKGYYFNQAETLSLIDLYYNSKFESGPTDKNNQRKIFLNVGKFRSEVSSKQIELDTKNGKFFPTDYADPWAAIFMQKDFQDWAKDSYFGELLNDCVEKFPKYGSVVLKKVGKEIKFVPLQNLKNEQTAESLQTAKFVIEEHPDMSPWEMSEMEGWNMEGLNLRFDQTMTVYERYGYVPLKWLKEINEEKIEEGDEYKFVSAMVICGKKPSNSKQNAGWHVFFAQERAERPYWEAHWVKQHGRWLGLGVMEDLIENQEAKNIIVNLIRKKLHWAAKVIGMSANENMAAKNLVRDVKDGEVLEVGPQGEIKLLEFPNRNTSEFQQFLNEFEKNSDQKAFTYEVATGEQLNSGTPFRLGVLLSSATNSFFDGKRERLGLLLERVVNECLVPQFLMDMGNKDKVLSLFPSESGLDVVLEATMNFVRAEAARLSILSGQPVDATALIQAVSPFEAANALFFNRKANYYKNLGSSFIFQFTNEAVDTQSKLESLKSLFTLFAQRGDPRAEKVLQKIAAISGESLAQFGAPQMQQTTTPPSPTPAPAGAPVPALPANATA